MSGSDCVLRSSRRPRRIRTARIRLAFANAARCCCLIWLSLCCPPQGARRATDSTIREMCAKRLGISHRRSCFVKTLLYSAAVVYVHEGYRLQASARSLAHSATQSCMFALFCFLFSFFRFFVFGRLLLRETKPKQDFSTPSQAFSTGDAKRHPLLSKRAIVQFLRGIYW